MYFCCEFKKLYMTNKFTLCILLFLVFQSVYVKGQNIVISGKISDSISGQPLAFVNIVAGDHTTGTLSDVDGKFRIIVSGNSGSLKFTYVGYHTRTVFVEKQENIHVKMSPQSFELSEVLIFPGENPAHRIIKKVIENRDINNPMKQTSFTYKAYNRFIINPNTDQLRQLADSLPDDTTIQQITKFTGRQYLFLMESVTERYFVKPDKSSETILAYKISGFEDPLFSMLITQIQPFTFYDDFIKLFSVNYVNPLSKGSTAKYYFQLEDTIYPGKDSVYIISFRPFAGTNFDGLKGLLYISTDGYAVQNVIAESANPKLNQLKIQQMYEKIDGRQWFPVQLNTDISLNMVQTNGGVKFAGIGRTYLRDIVLDNSIKRYMAGNAEVEVDPSADKNSAALLDQYRLNKLDAKDSLTYHTIDSIGKKAKLDKRVSNLNTILNGKIPYKFLDFDINKLLDVNKYEKIRIGLGINTNRRLSMAFSLGIYAAYGFGDHKLKYGGNVEFKLHHKSATYIKAYYFDDIAETGKYEFLEAPALFSSEWLRTISLHRFDHYRRIGLEVKSRPLSPLQLKVGLSLSDITNLYDYRFHDFPCGSGTFRDFSLSFALRYAYQERIIRNLDYDVVVKNEKGPILDFAYIRGFRNILGGDYSYNKFNVKIKKAFLFKYSGKLTLTGIAAYADRSLPLSLLFSAKGSDDSYYFQINETFTTMNSDEYYSDVCASLFARHEFPGFFKKHFWFDPKINVFASAGWGNLNHKTNHLVIEVKSPEKVYTEAGLMLNDLVNLKILSFGGGVFYRFGYYSSIHEKNNFYPRWNLKIKI
mgnify:CR=1 FL=1